jgi:hypothetical protein
LKHRLLFLNLILVGITAAGGWRLREEWLHYQQRTNAVLQHKVKPPVVPAAVPLPPAAPFVSVTYSDVAQKDLFAKDRNPNVVVEPVAVKPKPPWPPNPVLYGVMGLPSGMTAMLAEKKDAPTRGIKVGEMVGQLKLVGLNTRTLTFEFDGERKEQKVEDLVYRGAPDAAGAAASAPPSANPANVAAAQAARNSPPPPPKPGVEIGAQMKACNPADTSPAGTVVDGYKKVLEQTPFGPACRWIAGN